MGNGVGDKTMSGGEVRSETLRNRRKGGRDTFFLIEYGHTDLSSLSYFAAVVAAGPLTLEIERRRVNELAVVLLIIWTAKTPE